MRKEAPYETMDATQQFLFGSLVPESTARGSFQTPSMGLNFTKLYVCCFDCSEMLVCSVLVTPTLRIPQHSVLDEPGLSSGHVLFNSAPLVLPPPLYFAPEFNHHEYTEPRDFPN